MAGLVGETLDHYRLVEQIGQGGMSTVYRAADTRTSQEVAVKVLSPGISTDKRFVRRFRREAGLLFRLRHPNIVPVTDYGEARGIVYLVMPLVIGETLQARITQQRITRPELARWVAQVAEALQFAHDQGVMHRDIKPSNVLISRTGNALLTDFGLARMIEGSASLTGSMLMGTPAYVSPEQAKGLPLDARSDQYALGVILYQLTAGRLPFEGDTPMGTAMMHIQEPAPPIRRFNKEASPAVERVIVKCLSKDPAGRFPSVAALNAAYQAALAGGDAIDTNLATQVAQPAARAGRVLAPKRRSPRWVWIGIGTLTAGVAGLAFLVVGPSLMGGGPPARPTATIPVVIDLPSPSPAPTSTPAPTVAPTPVVSASCSWLRLISARRDGNTLSWMIDNGGNADIRLVGIPTLEWDERNPLVEVRLGGQTILPPPGQSIGPDSTFQLSGGEATRIGAGQGKELSLVYAWSDIDTYYRFDLLFSGNCTLAVNP